MAANQAIADALRKRKMAECIVVHWLIVEPEHCLRSYLASCYARKVNLYDLDPGPESPEIVHMIVEIPKNSANKYEYDARYGVFRLDRTLYSPMHYPGDYGFVPGTLADDGDPLDVLVQVQEPSFPGCMIEVRAVGVLNLMDNEEGDQKILGVPMRDPRCDQIHTIDQVMPHVRREIEHFFSIYKELEGKQTRIQGWGGPKEARELIQRSREQFLKSKAPAKARAKASPSATAARKRS